MDEMGTALKLETKTDSRSMALHSTRKSLAWPGRSPRVARGQVHHDGVHFPMQQLRKCTWLKARPSNTPLRSTSTATMTYNACMATIVYSHYHLHHNRVLPHNMLRCSAIMLQCVATCYATHSIAALLCRGPRCCLNVCEHARGRRLACLRQLHTCARASD